MSINNFYLSQRLGNELQAHGLKLALAESCTGGGLACEITAVPGSSVWFERGFVTYSDDAKMAMLGVFEQTLADYGAVSEQTAVEMAKGALLNSLADIALSITGVAGPGGGTPAKPVGMVCFAVAIRDRHYTVARTMHFYSGRKNIRDCAIAYALDWLLDEVSGRKYSSM